jgi:uncharacterized membrane protein
LKLKLLRLSASPSGSTAVRAKRSRRVASAPLRVPTVERGLLVRAAELAQEVTRPRREASQVVALAFAYEGVEDERRLA